MNKAEALEILKLEAQSKRRKADEAWDYPSNWSLAKKHQAQVRAYGLRKEAEAIEFAVAVLEAQ